MVFFKKLPEQAWYAIRIENHWFGSSLAFGVPACSPTIDASHLLSQEYSISYNPWMCWVSHFCAFVGSFTRSAFPCILGLGAPPQLSVICSQRAAVVPCTNIYYWTSKYFVIICVAAPLFDREFPGCRGHVWLFFLSPEPGVFPEVWSVLHKGWMDCNLSFRFHNKATECVLLFLVF